MKRKTEKKRGTLKRKLKYLLLLLLLSFNFSFAFIHINKLNYEINKLNMELASQQALIDQTDSKVDMIQKAVTLHEMKINILSKADHGKVVKTLTKVIETQPFEPSQIHLIDPATIITTAGVAISHVLYSLHKVGEIFN